MRRTTLITLLACAVTSALALAPLGAQGEPVTAVEGTVDVTEVALDVLVTDGSGNVIIGLGADDFVVEEEGEPVELNAATFYSNRRFVDALQRAESANVDPDAIPVDRYFILFIHDRRQEVSDAVPQMLDMARHARRWVDTQRQSNDYVAVVSYDVKLKVFTDFTTDGQQIKKAIENAVQGKAEIENWPSRRAEHTGPSLLESLPEGRELRRQSFDFHKGLHLVAEAVGGIEARKNLLLFSPGFGEVDEANTYTPDPRWYPDMVQALNDHNVAVYSVDLFPTADAGIALGRTLNDSLSNLSADTGGRYYWHFNNFATPLQQVEEDNNGYYLLSYTSTYPADESGYRRVTITTKNPQFQVRGREGFRYGGS